MGFPDSFFARKFNITERDLESYLAEALSSGGDYADLYFEYVSTSAISIDESIVKSATQGVTLGVGIRVIQASVQGTRTPTISLPRRFVKAAKVAACIANGPSQVDKTGLQEGTKRDLYPVLVAPGETSLAERVDAC